MNNPRNYASVGTYIPRSSTYTLQRRDATHAATPRNVQSGRNGLSYSEAAARDRHERHDRDWWRQHYSNIVLADGGYYYWDDDYWYPAWGYDPSYNYYDYDGPIYAYGDLTPDQVIASVQTQLQQDGYYDGAVNGILDPTTRAAIANFQRDRDLAVTSAVDEPTVEALGLA